MCFISCLRRLQIRDRQCLFKIKIWWGFFVEIQIVSYYVDYSKSNITLFVHCECWISYVEMGHLLDKVYAREALLYNGAELWTYPLKGNRKRSSKQLFCQGSLRWILQCSLQIQPLKLMYCLLYLLLNTKFKFLLFQIYVFSQKQNSWPVITNKSAF